MDKAAWVAIIGSLSGMVVAVLASLYGLGEHAPGVVLGLLVVALMLAWNVYLVRQVEQFRCEAREREASLSEVLKTVAVWLEKDTAATQEMARSQGLEALLTRWREEQIAATRVEGAAAIATAVTNHAASVARDVVNEAARVAKEVNNAKPS